MDYSAGEVRWLLAMRRDEAIEADQPPSFLSQPDGGGDAASRLPTIARWADVQRARRVVMNRRRAGAQAREADEALAAAKLTAMGATEREVADRLDLAQRTINRRLRSFVDEVLEVLGCAPDGSR
jgi:DNA-binding NtrC family response regulator